MTANSETTATIGPDIGITICQNSRHVPAPSTIAASYSSLGNASKNCFMIKTLNACAPAGSQTAQGVFAIEPPVIGRSRIVR